MAEEDAAQVDDETTAATEDGEEPASDATDDKFDERSADLTGPGGADADAPIAEINRNEVTAAADHLDDSNLDGDRDTLKRLQNEM